MPRPYTASRITGEPSAPHLKWINVAIQKILDVATVADLGTSMGEIILDSRETTK